VKKKIALWDHMKSALGDPDDLAPALAAVNSALRRKLQPTSGR
jgi:hypothetical protein